MGGKWHGEGSNPGSPTLEPVSLSFNAKMLICRVFQWSIGTMRHVSETERFLSLSGIVPDKK